MPASVLTCVDFSAMPVGPGPNPLIIGAASFRSFDHTGAPLPNTQIRTQGAFKGLDCARRVQVRLRRPTTAICLSIMHTATPGKIEFFGPSGVIATVAIPAAQNVAHEIVATGRAIRQVVITAPADETLLLHFCYA